MRRLFGLIVVCFLVYAGWPYIQPALDKTDFKSILGDLQTQIENIKDDPDYQKAMETLQDEITQFAAQINLKNAEEPESIEAQGPAAKKPELREPVQQTFSIYNIELGDSREKVERETGPAQREVMSEYGVKWHVYHENYQNFMLAAYNDSDQVVGLYTSQNLISSTKGIKRGTPKETVEKVLGKGMDQMRKGLTYYQFEKDRDFDLFLLDDSFVTIFYDKHQNNTVTAIQIVDKQLEQEKADYFAADSDELKSGFEYLLFDLTNASRVNHGLRVLSWDDKVKITARKHSDDMAGQNYFSHTNLNGESPFDRMKQDDILFSLAGENLAMGQMSSIFAHEGLMNSKGHRENILQPGFRLLGVGVAFNGENRPYFTENFYAK